MCENHTAARLRKCFLADLLRTTIMPLADKNNNTISLNFSNASLRLAQITQGRLVLRKWSAYSQ